jgi:hypothetical protein
LLGQKRYADAEPLLVEACQGLERRQAEEPTSERSRALIRAGKLLVQLYEDWGKPDEAAKWREKLNAPADVQP